ncbi:MAG TPA: hypothetical protein VM911_07245 [Pyrinomonadaceae bacterium]|jgi:hypothetical protein|nr:hypothetical protein [Pyrinomonadaceae bacterium]
MSEELRPEITRMTDALAPVVDRSQFMPAMSIELAVERYNTITEFVSRVLRRDVDYGMIPGTDKLTLLKPGAEKLTTFFGLSTRFQLLERIEDWTGEDHQDEPFFYYLYRCQLFRGDLLVAEADGSCNSRETKYRYREAQRVCPECRQAAIIKGKEEYGGGWLCFKKKGGCGAKFPVGDATIESQQTGRMPNAEIADQVNTIQKMGQKRSLIAATLLAVNASEFFTQDVEDFINTTATTVITPSVNQSKDEPAVGPSVDESNLKRELLAACRRLGKTEDQLTNYLKKRYGADGIDGLTLVQKREALSFLHGKIAQQEQQHAA